MRPPKGLGQKWSLGEVVALVKRYAPVGPLPKGGGEGVPMSRVEFKK